jgi:hypothetical protein
MHGLEAHVRKEDEDADTKKKAFATPLAQGCQMAPWHQPMPPYGPPPGWGWGRPSLEDEKEYLDEYIEMLKEELAAAEEYRKELEEPEA